MTTTALGRSDTIYADSGGTFQVADQRRLYRFRLAARYRYHADTGQFTVTQENEFRDGLSELGIAARASASFPIAFALVQAILAGWEQCCPWHLDVGPQRGRGGWALQ